MVDYAWVAQEYHHEGNTIARTDPDAARAAAGLLRGFVYHRPSAPRMQERQ